MRILLTGATGFIGKHIGKSLEERDHEVWVVTRQDPDKTLKSLKFASRAFKIDLNANMFMNDELASVDAVINLAGENISEGRWTSSKRRQILLSRVASTQNLLASFKRLNAAPRVWVNASAIGYYGHRESTILNERTSKGEGFLADVCEQWENVVSTSEAYMPEMRKVWIRSGMVLGKDGGAFQKLLSIFNYGLGAPLGSGQQWVSWIHIEDLVAMFIGAVEHEEYEGVYNGTSPNPVVNEEFTQTLAEALEQSTLPAVPGFVLRLLLGEMSTLLLASQNIWPDKITRVPFQFRYCTLKSAIKDLTSE